MEILIRTLLCSVRDPETDKRTDTDRQNEPRETLDHKGNRNQDLTTAVPLVLEAYSGQKHKLSSTFQHFKFSPCSLAVVFGL